MKALCFRGGGSGAPPTEQGHLSVAVQLGMHGRNVAVACRLSERGLAAKSPFRKTGGGGMIRHRLLYLGYFDFGSAGLFSLGFLSLFAVHAQYGQNAAADEQSSQPTDEANAVTGLRRLGGVVLSGLIGVIITAACIAGIAAVGELVDDRILAALGAANGAFLVPTTGGLLGSGLVAALALMPVIGVVILPIRAVAVGMSAACCGDRCGFKNLLADGAFLLAHSSTRKGK